MKANHTCKQTESASPHQIKDIYLRLINPCILRQISDVFLDSLIAVIKNKQLIINRFRFVSVLCLVASVLSLTLIAYDRFFGIVYALKAHMSHRKARFSIGIIWLCSFAIAAPLLWFRELKERKWADYTERWCDDTWPIVEKVIPGTNITTSYMPARTIYFTFVSAVLYFVPMLVMTIAYSVIIRKLRSTTMPGEHVDAGYASQQKTKRKVRQ